MTSGISWPESTDWHHFFGPMIQSGNWIDFILRRDMETSPGARFNYNSGNPHLVSKIIQSATGKNMFDYGKEKLFHKLDMKSVRWYFDPQGVCFGGAWIQMTVHDALKIGQLILDDGRWNGEQIVSKAWIDKIGTKQSDGYRWDEYIGGDYGYCWWINNYHGCKTVFAWGAREQYIFITPELNLVAVFTGAYDNYGKRPPYIYSEYVIKMLSSDTDH
jgi:CubicO group peptidase (beta-lactamase class C family)